MLGGSFGLGPFQRFQQPNWGSEFLNSQLESRVLLFQLDEAVNLQRLFPLPIEDLLLQSDPDGGDQDNERQCGTEAEEHGS